MLLNCRAVVCWTVTSFSLSVNGDQATRLCLDVCGAILTHVIKRSLNSDCSVASVARSCAPWWKNCDESISALVCFIPTASEVGSLDRLQECSVEYQGALGAVFTGELANSATSARLKIGNNRSCGIEKRPWSVAP